MSCSRSLDDSSLSIIISLVGSGDEIHGVSSHLSSHSSSVESPDDRKRMTKRQAGSKCLALRRQPNLIKFTRNLISTRRLLRNVQGDAVLLCVTPPGDSGPEWSFGPEIPTMDMISQHCSVDHSSIINAMATP
jgi:hypothetical protein